MLSNLYIENIAVIEKTNIDFTHGFNVLTGETGAGKSIVIDSINAVLGSRTTKQIIRNGSNSAFVSATFTDVSKYVEKKARTLGFEVEDGMVILQREMSLSGKNNCRINSRPATVSALKELSQYLINIHGQSDNAELMSPSLHLHYIDALSQTQPLLLKYREKYNEYVVAKEAFENVSDDEEARLAQIDLLRYQIDELESADITVGESDALNQEKTVLLNSDKIIKSLLKSKSILDGDDDIDGVISMTDDASSALSVSARYQESLSDISDRLANALYELKDISSLIEDSISDIEADPYRLEQIEERLDLLYRLSRKYGATEEEMLEYLESSKTKLKELEDYDTNREKLKERFIQLELQARDIAQKLSDIRHQKAQEFASQVQKEMAFLEMPNVRLVVDFKECELSKSGIDKVEFLISVNLGEDPKPVTKIASGGELSRMMLAIKTVLSRHDIVDTMIFDEIDTGISGSAAQKVGMKLKEVSRERQVMCVTHQAQIAALADSHFLINKEFTNDKTYTQVKKLDTDGRVHELARIIDGVNITHTALEHAKNLLADA
ncbi:MAG: DNA repair protein RecN [Ruminococcaceae bacterium]|nr:DNA repair protein RecN [Oscillospiraceae bacterium]